MRIASQPVEGRRIDRFRPPHCPWPECRDHRPAKRYRCSRKGSFRRDADPRRRVPRFRCPSCRRTFSLQTFACTYYLKRPELLLPVAAGLVAGSAHRQIARSLGCAPSTVTRLAARIGRHALLLQALALQHLQDLEEPIVLDHFETFVFSQEDRLGIATPVGQKSWFSYGLDPAPHRRGGKRSVRKRALRRPLPPQQPGSVVRSTEQVFRLLLGLSGDGVEVVSDDHPAYRQAERSAGRLGSIRRRIYPNPPRGPGSDRALARERDRQMFAVDLLHKLWRHTQAHQRRETIAFGRRSNAVLERGFLFIVWRNFVKKVSERTGEAITPAMRLGLLPRPLEWSEVFSRRLFPGRIRLPRGWLKVYRRGWITPAVGRNLPHALAQAF
jgi:transposase-like protein